MALIKGRVGVLANRPDRGTHLGARYLATDQNILYEWNGANWITPDGSVLGSGISLGANEMVSTAAYSFTSGMPRLVFPDAVTTSAFIVIGLQSSFLLPEFLRLQIGWDWTNDHTAGGNVRWRVVLRENTIGGLISAPDVIADVSTTQLAPGANGGLITSAPVLLDNLQLSPAAFGSLYSLEISRLGGDPLDTLAGPVGLCECVLIRTEAA